MGSASPIRVAMVHGPGRADRDGVSDYIAHLLPALGEVGVEAVSVPVTPLARRAGQPTDASGADWGRGVQRAAEQVGEADPHLVHVQFAPSAYRFSGVPGALLPGLLPSRVPLVTTVHEYGWWAVPEWLPTLLWPPLERLRLWDRETGRLVPASSAVICTNPDHAGQVSGRTGKRPVVIPLAANVSPVPVQVAPKETRARLGVPGDATVVAFFGFVHPVKGLRYVIAGLPELVSSGLDLHLLVVGGFTSQALPEPEAVAFREELEALCREHGVTDRVSFTGHLPDAEVSAALQASDLGVLPFTEGVTTKSGALLTLLGHGLPTAVTRPEHADDALRDGENVAVIRARRSTPAVVQTLRRLVRDDVLRARLRERGRALAEQHAWPQVAAAHRRVYDQVLAGSRG